MLASGRWPPALNKIMYLTNFPSNVVSISHVVGQQGIGVFSVRPAYGPLVAMSWSFAYSRVLAPVLQVIATFDQVCAWSLWVGPICMRFYDF